MTCGGRDPDYLVGMFGKYTRYAIYWTPPADSALAAFGARWLGWDMDARRSVPQPEDVPDLPAITATPRRYGFHGTMKAPFKLAQGRVAAELDGALTRFAAGRPAAGTLKLALTDHFGFLALTPAEPVPGLDALAAASVTDLDPFRAPPDEAELERRRKAGLTPEQDANLMIWGYPFVLDQFRFHMTLSGRLSALDPDARAALHGVAARMAGPALAKPLEVTEITLCGDPGDGAPFHMLARYALTG